MTGILHCVVVRVDRQSVIAEHNESLDATGNGGFNQSQLVPMVRATIAAALESAPKLGEFQHIELEKKLLFVYLCDAEFLYGAIVGQQVIYLLIVFRCFSDFALCVSFLSSIKYNFARCGYEYTHVFVCLFCILVYVEKRG
jgi:hypothetical protein